MYWPSDLQTTRTAIVRSRTGTIGFDRGGRGSTRIAGRPPGSRRGGPRNGGRSASCRGRTLAGAGSRGEEPLSAPARCSPFLQRRDLPWPAERTSASSRRYSETRSLLIWGTSNSGKTALVARTLSNLPERITRRCICARGNGAPQEILREIAQGFVEDSLFRSKFRADTGFGASFSHWVKAQTSLRLRGLLYRAAGAGKYWIFLEDLVPMTHMLARIIKELMLNQETPIYAVAQGWTYSELGHGAQLYWNDRQRLHVGR